MLNGRVPFGGILVFGRAIVKWILKAAM